MKKQMLIRIATTILNEAIGPGFWVRRSETQKLPKGYSPLPGVEVGDTVYSFSVDDDEMQEHKVAHVSDGVGYVIVQPRWSEPMLLAVSEENFATSLDSAIEMWRDDIEEAISYSQEKAEKAATLRDLIKH